MVDSFFIRAWVDKAADAVEKYYAKHDGKPITTMELFNNVLMKDWGAGWKFDVMVSLLPYESQIKAALSKHGWNESGGLWSKSAKATAPHESGPKKRGRPPKSE